MCALHCWPFVFLSALFFNAHHFSVTELSAFYNVMAHTSIGAVVANKFIGLNGCTFNNLSLLRFDNFALYLFNATLSKLFTILGNRCLFLFHYFEISAKKKNGIDAKFNLIFRYLKVSRKNGGDEAENQYRLINTFNNIAYRVNKQRTARRYTYRLTSYSNQ